MTPSFAGPFDYFYFFPFTSNAIEYAPYSWHLQLCPVEHSSPWRKSATATAGG
jgi:hypothetical protein